MVRGVLRAKSRRRFDGGKCLRDATSKYFEKILKLEKFRKSSKKILKLEKI